MKELSTVEADNFRNAYSSSRIHTSVIYSSYLLNLGASGELWNKSVNSLRDGLCKADMLGLKYVVLHPGFCNITRVKNGILQALSETQSKAKILIENAA